VRMKTAVRTALRAPAHPVQIDLDLSNRCNLFCRFCHFRYFKPKSADDFTYEKFLTLAPLLPHLKKVTLFSKFEPLVCRDFLKIYRAIAACPNIELYFSTNGVLLNREIIDALTGRLKYLTVSITGFTRENYRKNMGKDALPIVLKNLRLLKAAKKRARTDLPIVRISTVGALDTVHELTSAVDIAHQMDAREGVQVTSLIGYDDDLAKLMPLKNPDYFLAHARTAQACAKKLGVKFVLQSGDFDQNKQATGALGHAACTIPWHRMSIQPNGDVYPCPVSYEPVGNIFRQSALAIWRGKKMRAFRAGVNNPRRMNYSCSVCIHCRHKSISTRAMNDLSSAKTYIAGMRRRKDR
jgi:radical SAM protein with 4Fe4S-binding SPASM domain